MNKTQLIDVIAEKADLSKPRQRQRWNLLWLRSLSL